jgi:YaiO family outer membrane protein
MMNRPPQPSCDDKWKAGMSASSQLISSVLRHGLLVAAFFAAASSAGGQEPVHPPRPTPWALEVNTFYSALDNNYGDWQGGSVRLSYSSPRFSPMLSLAVQHRDVGSQASMSLGSYVILDSHTYMILGVSSAPAGDVVLFPKERYDVALITDTRVVRGLVWGASYTQLSLGGSTGRILGTGPIYYRGPLILAGSLRLNHDGVGGLNSFSGDVGGQYGAQGRQWLGVRLSYGKEAYEILAASPLEVHFTNLGSSLFYQRWVRPKNAIMGRVSYDHKFTAYQSLAFELGYRVEF